MSAERFDLDDYVRRLAREEAERILETVVPEWLDVPRAAEYISVTERHMRELVARLKETSPDDVYQPNGPGTKPLVVRRRALRDLNDA